MDSDQEVNQFGVSMTPEPTPTPPITTPIPGPNAPDGMPASKKSKLGLILGLSIGGVLLIGITVLVLMLTLGGGVSQEDYQEAQETTAGVRVPYDKISSFSLVNSSGYFESNSIIEDRIESLDKNRTVFNEEFKKLGELTAIENDKDANKLYKKAVEQKAKFDVYLDVTVEAGELVLPVLNEYDKYNNYRYKASDLAKLKTVVTEFKELKLAQAINKTFVDEFGPAISEYISATEECAKNNNVDEDEQACPYERDSEAYERYSEANSELNSIKDDWRADLKKLKDDSFNDKLSNLSEYITEKVNAK